jgi:uncharacterized membrane protein YhaH (DUF805 family)
MNYVILFKGEILPGFDPDKVINDFALLEGINRELAAKVFSGEFFVLRDNLTKNDIAGYFPTLAKIGMNVYMEQTVPQGSLSFALMKADLTRPAPVQTVPTGQVSYAPTTQQSLGVGFQARPQNSQPDDVPPPSWFAFGGQGRMGRLNYINANTILYLVVAIPAIILAVILVYTMEQNISSGVVVSGILLGILCLFLIIYSIRYMVLRLHDLNLPGPWVILILAINAITGGMTSFVVSICLMAIPGTLGVNKFGAPSRQGSIAGLIITIVGTVLLILTAIIIAAFAASYGGAF